MEGTHRKVGNRPFMPDPTLTCLCSALLGHIAKLGSITHPKQRRATFPDLLSYRVAAGHARALDNNSSAASRERVLAWSIASLRVYIKIATQHAICVRA